MDNGAAVLVIKITIFIISFFQSSRIIIKNLAHERTYNHDKFKWRDLLCHAHTKYP